jgi:hypothetical protein
MSTQRTNGELAKANQELDSLETIVREFEKYDREAWLRMLRYLMHRYGKPLWRIL